MDENKRNKILEMTIEAFKKINKKRFYKSERGYQGRLLCALYFLMDEVNIFSEDTIIEQEYQKGTSSHGTTQRPDIIIHVPVEHSGARITENNYVVYALKKNTSDIDAQDDFNTVPTIRPDSLSEQTMLKEMFLGCHIPMLTVMMRKDILIKAGGFKSYGTLIGADYATWLSLLPYGEFIFLNAVLSKWRMHDGNLSKSQSNKIKEVFDCGYFWYKRMPKEFKKKVGMNDWQMYILNRYRMLKSFLIYYKNKGGR